MKPTLNDRFLASCVAASLGESIALPTEGMNPEQIRAHFGTISGPVARPDSPDFYPLAPGSTARQTEALLAVLKASRPLPDLAGFAFNIKDAFNRFQMLWPKNAAFPWPPFPDEGHYTFAFAFPAAYRLAAGKSTKAELAEWLKSLSPVSVVWQQGTWIYLRLLAKLYVTDEATFSAADAMKSAMEFADEAEDLFPHDHKMKRKMQVTEPLLDRPLSEVASACGNIDHAAENILTFVGNAFYKYHNDFETGLLSTTHQGGTSGAVGFYLGSLIGALRGQHTLPGAWLHQLKVKESVSSAVFEYIH